jgi:hypothetical protein
MLLARALPRAMLARAPVNVVFKRAFGAVAPGKCFFLGIILKKRKPFPFFSSSPLLTSLLFSTSYFL